MTFKSLQNYSNLYAHYNFVCMCKYLFTHIYTTYTYKILTVFMYLTVHLCIAMYVCVCVKELAMNKNVIVHHKNLLKSAFKKYIK